MPFSWIWVGFSIFVVIALSIDTFVVTKKNMGPNRSIRAAVIWSIVWVSCALLFNILLWLYTYRTANLAIANEKALNFFTGYLIEKTLAFDNLFAFYLIFTQFHIPLKYQHRVFTYGIWSAIFLRLFLILFGSWLITHFHWTFYLMGAFLLATGLNMLRSNAYEEKNLKAGLMWRLANKFMRMTHKIESENFFVRKKGVLYATPLFIALIFIEISDIIFASDSIPAIFAITTDPFIVWSSNIFAILGLRALYFLLAGIVERFYLLKYGITLILIFIGSKMLLEPWFIIPVQVSLMVILLILITFGVLSKYKGLKYHDHKKD